MSRLNLFKTVSMTLVAAAVCLSVQAQATTLTTKLNFGAPTQSLWGPGTSTSSIHYASNIKIEWPYDVGTSTFGYSVNADNGQVFGSVDGSVATNYVSALSKPGLTFISLKYTGDRTGGLLATVFGASASVTAFGQTWGPDFSMVTDTAFTPVVTPAPPPAAAEAVGSTVTDIVHQGVNWSAASGGWDLSALQDTFFRPTGVEGTLYYQREGRGLIQSARFNLTSRGMLLPVNLREAGTYDFWFGSNWILQNWFYSAAYLDVYAHASAVGQSWSDTVANPMLYSTPPFALNFEAKAQNTAFMIKVGGVRAVPVPRSLGLVMLGGGILLLGVLDSRRRRGAWLPDDTVV